MRKQIKVGLFGLAAVVTVSLYPSVHATEARCAGAADVDAFAIRDLQSQLMVAGLACGQSELYAAFVARHKVGLGRAGRRLIEYFHSNAGGIRDLDTHVTRAANAASRRYSEGRSTYCAQTAQLFRNVLGESKRSFIQVARTAKLNAVAKPIVCTAKAPTSADASTYSTQ